MKAPSVVKLGGSLLEDPERRARALAAVASRWVAGERLVLVHGGGRRIDAALASLGIPRRICQGLRVTDAATLEVVIAVLCGGVNKSLVAELTARGIRCAGISGLDGGTLQAEPHPAVEGVDLGFVGAMTSADSALAQALLGSGFLPVLAPVAAGPGGEALNVNADSAAAALAAALGAERLVFLTDVEGLLDARGCRIEHLDANGLAALREAEFVTGGMRPKLEACARALEQGVPTVCIAGPGRHGTVLVDGVGGTRLVAA